MPYESVYSLQKQKEIDMREYSYAELCRMKKKRVIRIAGYQNIKTLMTDFPDERFAFSKKKIARMIASDR